MLIEDFDFDAANPVTAMWLHGVASRLMAAAVPLVRHWLIAGLLGKGPKIEPRKWDEQEHHGLEAVRRLLAATGLPLLEEVTECLFRYVETSVPGVQERVRQADATLITAGTIEPLGRRFVVE